MQDLAASVTDSAAIPQQGIDAFEAVDTSTGQGYADGVNAEQAVHQQGIDAWAALADTATDPNVQAVALANRDSASIIADELLDAHLLVVNFGDDAMLIEMDTVLTNWENYNQWALTQSAATLIHFDDWLAIQ